MHEIAYFTETADGLMPLDLARSSWNLEQLHGVAASGAMARAAERTASELGRDDLRPARWRVDLFRPVRFAECVFETTVVRNGKRICLIDVVLTQDGVAAARATATFLKVTADVPGAVWAPNPASYPTPPPLEIAPVTDRPHVPIFHSDAGWSQEFGEHQNAGQHAQWSTQPSIVRGQPTTGFAAVAGAADGVNLVTNWGAEGVDFINADLDLTLVRVPTGVQIGLQVTDRLAADGIVVGTAVLFDRSGPLGTATTTCLANSLRSIDFSTVSYDDRGRLS